MKILEMERQFRAPLLAYFRRRLIKSHDAEDLVQDVLFKLAQRRDFQDIEKPKSYIFQVASNRLSDYFKKENNRADKSHYRIGDLLAEAHIVHELVEEIEPERILIGKSELSAVRAALCEVGPRTRDIFLLYRVDGLRRREIAGRYGISVSMVEKHLAKAVSCIARYLESGND